MNTTPISLLEQLREPNQPQAWKRFVQLYTPLLYYWLRRAGVPTADAADVVQDVFVVLVRKLPAFAYDRAGSFRGWLRTLTLNKWRENCRRHGGVSGDLSSRREKAAPPDELDRCATPDGRDALDEAEYRHHLVGRALRLMQNEFEPAVWKSCWECVVAGRTAADVAAELGLRPEDVYLAKYRVLRRLRRELDGLLD